MTITALIFCVIAMLLGAIGGWVVGSAIKRAETQRAIAERDAARLERERSERARAEMQRRIEEAQQATAVAETRAASRPAR